MRNFRLSSGDVSVDHLKFVGIEQITEQAHYSIIVPRAAATLIKAGVEIFPAPEIGKSYEFDVTTMDGSKLSSKTLLGKVVLLDFWATWCQPCMKMLPDLKKAYREFKNQGFEFYKHPPAEASKLNKLLYDARLSPSLVQRIVTNLDQVAKDYSLNPEERKLAQNLVDVGSTTGKVSDYVPPFVAFGVHPLMALMGIHATYPAAKKAAQEKVVAKS